MPDLIITDLMMDSLDAGFPFSAASRTTRAPPSVPIIISTSVTSALGLDFSPHSDEDLDKMRVDAYFDKPLDGRALLAKVAELLDARPEDPVMANDPSAMNQDRVAHNQLVTTIREKCRMCYTCVRECPVKAIEIRDGQASVIQTRCIACGNCVTVCSQNAKQVLSAVEDTDALLAAPAPVAAIVAPSYPAEFTECDTGVLVGALRDLGFDSVHEVAFGADLVAREYARLLWRRTTAATSRPPARPSSRTCASTTPTSLDRLAPIVSPMVATARALHRRLPAGARVVFVGPCIAKKGEAAYEQFEGEIDAVLTFVELRAMLEQRGVDLAVAARAADDDFDPPRGGLGDLFPLVRGLLQAAGLQEDLLDGEIVSADGRHDFGTAIEDFKRGETGARLLDILCCHGCIMGAGFTHEDPIFTRRAHVSRRARGRQRRLRPRRPGRRR